MSARLPARVAACALLAPFLIAGCVTAPAPQHPARTATGPGEHAARREGLGPQAWLSDWDRLVRTHTEKPRAGGPPHLEGPLIELHRGANLEVDFVALTRGSLPPPKDPAAEVLIAVEGRGILTLSGRQRLLDTGDVALLPRGSRGTLRVAGTRPLLGLLVRAVGKGRPAPAGRVAPRILSVSQAFPVGIERGPEASVRRVLGTLPGGLDLAALVVRRDRALPRHIHLAHDELLFLIHGYGTLGTGSEGGSRGFTSSPAPARSLIFIPAHTPHSYADEAFDGTLALQVFGPSFHGRDQFALKNTKTD